MCINGFLVLAKKVSEVENAVARLYLLVSRLFRPMVSVSQEAMCSEPRWHDSAEGNKAMPLSRLISPISTGGESGCKLGLCIINRCSYDSHTTNVL